jgi:alkanesulfonate monooxygenase SsuD/methylene tetrahydromethanopterin reductase-like flavin-dependent oxidoreductase (luciferase family)
MRFGVHYLTTYLPELDGSVPQFYRHLFEQVQEAEKLGFDDAWVTEHHYNHYGGLISQPPVFLAALARETSRIHLGVAICVLPLNNPLQNAEAYATLDVLSDGRLEFGVGRGATPEEFQEARVDYGDSPQRLREHAEVLLQAWSDEPIVFHGDLYAYDGVTVFPKPLQRPHPPIWVGASRSDDTFRWAGEKGFHLMTLPYAYEPSVLIHWIGIYQDTLRQHGYDPASREILGKLHVYVAESDAAARREAETYWLNYYQMLYGRGSWSVRQPPTPASYEEEVAKGHAIVGDPARCVELIERWRETFGLTTFSGTFHFGGMPQERALRSLRLFAERVMPHLPSKPLVSAKEGA